MYSSSLKAIFTTVDNRGTWWHPLRYGQITHARSHSNSSLRGALLLESDEVDIYNPLLETTLLQLVNDSELKVRFMSITCFWKQIKYAPVMKG